MVESRSKNNWYSAFKNFKNAMNFATDCAYQATVVAYDKSNHTADIQPLANYSDGSNKAQVLDVPVDKNCYAFDEWLESNKSSLGLKSVPQPMMHKGAVVTVIVLDNDSDEWDGTGSTYTPQTNRQHDVNDSRIVGCA